MAAHQVLGAAPGRWQRASQRGEARENVPGAGALQASGRMKGLCFPSHKWSNFSRKGPGYGWGTGVMCFQRADRTRGSAIHRKAQQGVREEVCQFWACHFGVLMDPGVEVSHEGAVGTQVPTAAAWVGTVQGGRARRGARPASGSAGRVLGRLPPGPGRAGIGHEPV